MAIYRHIHVSFWQDDYVLNLSPQEKFFYIYLMTNSKTSQCGIYQLPKKIIEFETGYSIDTVSILLNKFIEDGKLLYDEDTKEVFMTNWLKHNFSKSPKVLNCISNELSSVKSKKLLESFNQVVIQYGYPIDTVSIEWGGKQKEKQKQKEKDIKLHSEKFSAEEIPNQKKYSEEGYKFAEEFKKLLPESQNVTNKDLENWAVCFDQLQNIDKRKSDEIYEICKWGRNDSFWSSNFLSPLKLRKRNKENILYYDYFLNKIKTENKKNDSNNGRYSNNGKQLSDYEKRRQLTVDTVKDSRAKLAEKLQNGTIEAGL